MLARKSDLMLKNGTLASPATALARRVFPVPGGPTNRTPEGARAPSLVNLSGLFSNSCGVAAKVVAKLEQHGRADDAVSLSVCLSHTCSSQP